MVGFPVKVSLHSGDENEGFSLKLNGNPGHTLTESVFPLGCGVWSKLLMYLVVQQSCLLLVTSQAHTACLAGFITIFISVCVCTVCPTMSSSM